MVSHEDVAQELAEDRKEQEQQVLKREGVEEELMQEGRSELGERLDDVQDDAKGE